LLKISFLWMLYLCYLMMLDMHHQNASAKCTARIDDVRSWRYARAPQVKIVINHSRTRRSANNRWLTVLWVGQSLNRPFENLCAPTSQWSPVISACRKLPHWIWQYRPLSINHIRINGNWIKLISKEYLSCFSMMLFGDAYWL